LSGQFDNLTANFKIRAVGFPVGFERGLDFNQFGVPLMGFLPPQPVVNEPSSGESLPQLEPIRISTI
jgi:hypothetical protein